MSYSGWFCLNGTDVANNCRTVAYATNGASGACLPCVDIPGGCGCCDALHQDEPAYTTPAGGAGEDPAPWYDPATPESEHFYGILVTEITGMEPGQVTRQVTQRASGGGALVGRATQAAPTITVTALVLGADCCATEFGMRWLTSVLNDSCLGQDCEGGDLAFYTCCPDDCAPASDPASPGDSPGDSPGEVLPCDHYRRTFRNAALVSSPTILEQLPLNDGMSTGECGCMYEIEFQIAAGSPCQFLDPVTVAEGLTFTPETGDECRFEWRSEAECTDECPEPPGCADDPNCRDVRQPPRPRAPLVACSACDPWNLASTCADIETGMIPLHAEGVPVITINTGSAPMRSTRITFWYNPLPLPPGQLDPCDACTELVVSYIPANAHFVFDGASQQITVQCGVGEPQDAGGQVVAGEGTLPFTWPVIACSETNWTVCLSTDADVMDPAATVDVAVVSREC